MYCEVAPPEGRRPVAAAVIPTRRAIPLFGVYSFTAVGAEAARFGIRNARAETEPSANFRSTRQQI
jgi:hypothetical protein